MPNKSTDKFRKEWTEYAKNTPPNLTGKELDEHINKFFAGKVANRLSRPNLKHAALDVYKRLGRIRIPLPALVSRIMLDLGTSDETYMADFLAIHGFIRSEWGNAGLFSRRRGVEKGGIRIRDRVKL